MKAPVAFDENLQEIVVQAHLDVGATPQEIREKFQGCPTMTPDVVERALRKYAPVGAALERLMERGGTR